MKLLFLCSLVFMIPIAGTLVRALDRNSNNGEPIPVDSVDLNKYVGTWYEIARIPNSFQSKCAMNTTATERVAINDILKKQGYNPGDFVPTEQNVSNPPEQ